MRRRYLKLGSKGIGDGCKTFITFEAGPTHNGVESAIRLVKEAARSGADAIKFQFLDADKLVKDKTQLFSYSILVDKTTGETREVSEPLYDLLERRVLTTDEWKRVKAIADIEGIAFFATVNFEEDLDLAVAIKCDSIKIASSDVNHFPLLRRVGRLGLNVQLDTGNSEIEEIKRAVNILREEGCTSIIIHQCPSGYPARLPSICLRMIETLRKEFPECPIAYSDHTPDADMDIAAVALGADLIEKTITEDRLTKSVEHLFSIETNELRSFIDRIRDVEVALGEPRRILTDEQKINRLKLRRGVYAKEKIEEGSLVDLTKVEFRRPCMGIGSDVYDQACLRGLRFTASIDAGEAIRSGDIE